ncbi:MAG TPA: ISL3 family transposase [Patescibacteria group bacterium]|nr:ISL3 family transposase [Patescibacteria group bacterium]
MSTFTHNSMASMLNLQGLIIYKLSSDKKTINIKIGQPRKPSSCPYCNHNKLHSHGYGRNRSIKHGLAISGQMIILNWRSKRYKCLSCLRSFSQSPPKSLVTGRDRSSTVFNRQALREMQEKSFSSVAKNMRVSYTVLNKIITREVKENSLFELPKHGDISIGVDEHAFLKRKLATTMTLITPNKTLLGIIPTATSKALNNWIDTNFSEIDKQRVTEIAIDMTKSLKKQLRLQFPNAKFVIDKFHVVSYLNNIIKEEYNLTAKYSLKPEDKAKLPIRTKDLHITRVLAQDTSKWKPKRKQQVETVFKLMPKVAELWYAKEEMRAIYKECIDREEARERCQFVISLLPKKARGTITKHLEEILNYFDKHTTNAFTEGCHTKMKKLKRVSFGLKNPEIYVKKLELAFIPREKLIYPHTF